MRADADTLAPSRRDGLGRLFEISVKRPFIAAMMLLALARAQAEPDFTRPHTHLGASDSEGRIVVWKDLYPVQLSDGTNLPLRLRFSSAPAVGAPLFGTFWWCPLLESTFVQLNEGSYSVTTLGGRTAYLIERKGQLSSGDEKYKGHIVSPSEAVIEVDGWQYRYIGGRLVSLKTPSNIEVDLAYTAGRLTSMVEKGKGVLLSLQNGAPGSLPSRMVVNKDAYDLTAQQIPVVSVVAGQPLIAGYATSLGEIKGPMSGRFPIVFGRDGSYSMARQADYAQDRTYVWNSVTGQVISDGRWTYEVKPGKPDALGQLLPPMVSRKNAQGQVESYYYDLATGISEYHQADGTVTKRYYFTSVGPINSQLRKLTMSKGGKELANIQWSYDEQGRMIRERGADYEKDWLWQPNGKLGTHTETRNGQMQLQETYDENGRLSEQQRAGGMVYRYTYDREKTIIERLENGVPRLTQVIDPSVQQNVVFAVDAKAGSLTPVSPLPGAPASKNLDYLKTTALRALQANENGPKK